MLWAVNLGCIGFHVWPYLADDPEHADELRIDLDPSPGVVFEQVREAAGELKALLDEDGVVAPPEDHRQPGPARLRAARSLAGRHTRCAPRLSRSPASSSVADPI